MRTRNTRQEDVDWHLPPEDLHFEDPNTYQHKHYNTAVKYARTRAVAVDVGAHVGIHTRRLSKDFDVVYAIEPINYEYLTQNTLDLDNVRCINAGASNRAGKMYAHNPLESNSGAWELSTVTSKQEVEVITIDSLNLTQCDLIKIDTQGLEREVLEGARHTINKYKPVVWIEDRGTLTTYMLEEFCYNLKDAYNKDFVYTLAERTLRPQQARLLSYDNIRELTQEQLEIVYGNN